MAELFNKAEYHSSVFWMFECCFLYLFSKYKAIHLLLAWGLCLGITTAVFKRFSWQCLKDHELLRNRTTVKHIQTVSYIHFQKERKYFNSKLPKIYIQVIPKSNTINFLNVAHTLSRNALSHPQAQKTPSKRCYLICMAKVNQDFDNTKKSIPGTITNLLKNLKDYPV